MYYLNKKQFSGFIKNYGFSVAIVLFFVLDVVNFIIDEYIGLSHSRSVSVYGRGLFELGALYLLMKNLPSNKNALLLIFFFLLLPMIWLTLEYFKDEIDFSSAVIILKESNKFIFPILLFLLLKKSCLKTDYFDIIFKLIFFSSAIIVVLSFIFDISYFYTYNSNRFGFKPPLATQNEITFFWMIGVTYFGAKLLQKFEPFTFLIFIIVLFSAVILGTKGIFLFMVNSAIFLIFFLLKISLFNKIAFGLIIALLFVFFLNVSGVLSFFFELQQNEGVLFALTSKRSELIIGKFIPLIESWNWHNYLIGGAFNGFPITEMDVLDLFLVSGLIGSIIYFYLLFNTLFKFLRGNKLGYFFASQYVLIGALAGHFYSSGINSLFFAGLCFYLQQYFFIGNKLTSVNI